MNLPITDAELESLKDCQSARDWTEACIQIRSARDGEYPPDWADKVRDLGLMEEIYGAYQEEPMLQIIEI